MTYSETKQLREKVAGLRAEAAWDVRRSQINYATRQMNRAVSRGDDPRRWFWDTVLFRVQMQGEDLWEAIHAESREQQPHNEYIRLHGPEAFWEVV